MRLALAGGGTGGHVVPGLHLLQHLSARGALPEDVLWFSSGRPIEERVLVGALAGQARPVERVVLALEPEASGAPSWLRLLVRTPPALRRSREALERHGSEVLLALGGYTALPAVLAARTLGVPVVLLEINAVSGKATRSLAGLAERVVHAWPGARGARHACFGPPLGPGFLEREPTPAESARQREGLGFDPLRPLLLVLGGSQGAAPLNRFVREHAPELLAAGIQVLHQTGPGRLAEGIMSGSSSAPSVGYRSVEYLDDVPRALDAATLVLCRGGASTLAELAARARPALVVPYPHHRDRHQEKNALALGAGVRIVPERRCGGELVRALTELCGEGGRSARDDMANTLRRIVPRDGAARLADELLRSASRFRTKAASPRAEERE